MWLLSHSWILVSKWTSIQRNQVFWMHIIQIINTTAIHFLYPEVRKYGAWHTLLEAFWTEIEPGLDFLVKATKLLCQTPIIIGCIFCHKIKQFSFVFDIQTISQSDLVYIGCLFHLTRTYGHWFCSPIQLPERDSCVPNILFASSQAM